MSKHINMHRMDLTTKQIVRLRGAIKQAQSFCESNLALQRMLSRDDSLSDADRRQAESNALVTAECIAENNELLALIDRAQLVPLEVSATVT